jgi:hypothetical protein
MNSEMVLAGTAGFTSITKGKRMETGDRGDVADEVEIEFVV